MLASHNVIRRALFSVSDKSGLAAFATNLAGYNVSLIASGGTAHHLKEAGLAVEDIADITGFPSIMDGRVKTLHPAVHGGLLAIRGNPDHEQAMKNHNIHPFDLIAVTLYPFAETVNSGAGFDECIENIDIGGPAMIRAAAKNHDYVTVITDPNDYATVLDNIKANKGTTSSELRQRLAQKAYAHTAAYDAAVSGWLAEQREDDAPDIRLFGGSLRQRLRYGENPHQKATFYLSSDKRPGVATARQVQGKELGYNNINDADTAFELAASFNPDEAAAVVIVKHANPCGVAVGHTLSHAWERALACDPVSAFGGVIAINRPLDADTASGIVDIFSEVIIAPDADEKARAIVSAKKNLRLLLTDGLPEGKAGLAFQSVAGGFLVQERDRPRTTEGMLKTVTKRTPTSEEIEDMLFAFRVCGFVKSNAIVYVRNGATIGIGAGQMSRIDAARIAARKAQEHGHYDSPKGGSIVAASDAFFPFADGLLATLEAGASAVIQPGGSVRDEEVIAAADEHTISMVFTGVRHFRH